MSTLAPVREKDISAFYETKTHQLILTAKGSIPGIWLKPDFQREAFAGGLLFSLVSYTTGVDPPPKTDFDVTLKTHINLPLPHFNNKTVQVQTGLGSFPIVIHYGGFPGDVVSQNGNGTNGHSALLGEDSGNDKSQIVSSVLTPIDRYLTGGANLEITAQVPRDGASRTTIRPSFNPEFLKLVNSTYENDQITWTFQWAELPIRSEGQNPQLLDITRVTWNGVVGPAAVTSIIVQPYSIYFVLLK